MLSNAVLLFVFFLCVWVCVNPFGFPDIFFLDFFFVVFLCDVADVVAVAVVVGLINRRPITQRLSTRESPKKTKQKKRRQNQKKIKQNNSTPPHSLIERKEFREPPPFPTTTTTTTATTTTTKINPKGRRNKKPQLDYPGRHFIHSQIQHSGTVANRLKKLEISTKKKQTKKKKTEAAQSANLNLDNSKLLDFIYLMFFFFFFSKAVASN